MAPEANILHYKVIILTQNMIKNEHEKLWQYDLVCFNIKQVT